MVRECLTAHCCRGPEEADELLARANFVKNREYRWPHVREGRGWPRVRAGRGWGRVWRGMRKGGGAGDANHAVLPL